MTDLNQNSPENETARLPAKTSKKRTDAYDEPFGNVRTSPFDPQGTPVQRPAAPSGQTQSPPREPEVPHADNPYAETDSGTGSAKTGPVQTDSAKTGSAKTGSAQQRQSRPKSTSSSDTVKRTVRSEASQGNTSGKSSGRERSRSDDTVRSSTATPSGATRKKNDRKPEVDLELPRSARPAHKVIPFVLAGLAVFIGISLLLNLFCNWKNALPSASDHWMGPLGYYICYGLFGLFGPAAFVLPLLMLNLAVFWKRYIDNKLLLPKAIASAVFLVVLGAVIHVFCLTQIDPSQQNFSASDLMRYGAEMTGGGVIGGKLGYALYHICSYVGALIIGFLLLAGSLFCFLGMTPQHLLEYFRNRRKLRRPRNPSLSEQSAEEAGNRAKMEEKIRRTTTGQTSISDDDPDVFEKEAPLGAVRVVTPAPSKKQPEEKLAPMPIPPTDPNHGEQPFIPSIVNKALEKETGEPASNSTPAPAPVAAQANPTQKDPAPGHQEPAPAAPSLPAIDPSENRDGAVEPIFPKTDPRQAHRTPRAEKNFDLKTIFVNLDPVPTRPVQKHAPVPPEVPLPGSVRRDPAKATVEPVPQRPASQGTASGKVAPSPAAKPTSRPANPAARPTAPAANANGSSATVAPTGEAAKPLSGVRPAPSAATAKKASEGTVYRPADIKPQDYGLSKEEFEKMEATQIRLPRANADRGNASGTAKPSTPTASKAPANPKAPVSPKPSVPKATDAEKKPYIFPPVSYLHPAEPMTQENLEEIRANMEQLSATLSSFNVKTKEINYANGPTVTRYEVTPEAGVRVRTIVNLADDIALALRSPGGVRMEAPIPGKNAVGVEVPNPTRSTVYLRELIESRAFSEASSRLTACLGDDVAGHPLLMNIAKMPHLLVAGTTGSGKSVCINCIILSILYKARPDEVKLVLIDPKKVEFSIYKNIPHLMAPIVTTPKDAAGALQAAVEEMEHRFDLFEEVGVHDLAGYNNITKDDPDKPFLPQIVIIIDELADLMMTAPDEVETAICRIAQKARAAGMHLIVGTQRPSVDVVTGLIKSNIPSRIAFTVSSQVDSRTILDCVGAEKLTGRGDMLFAPIGALKPARVQGAFVDDSEVKKICEFIRATNGTAEYDEHFISKLKELAAQCGSKGKSNDIVPSGEDGGDRGNDPKYADAVRIAIEEKRVSTSLLQRKLEVGYSRAAKLIDRMQADGYVSPPDGSKPRAILITAEQYMEKFVDNPQSDADGSDEA